MKLMENLSGRSKIIAITLLSLGGLTMVGGLSSVAILSHSSYISPAYPEPNYDLSKIVPSNSYLLKAHLSYLPGNMDTKVALTADWSGYVEFGVDSCSQDITVTSTVAPGKTEVAKIAVVQAKNDEAYVKVLQANLALDPQAPLTSDWSLMRYDYPVDPRIIGVGEQVYNWPVWSLTLAKNKKTIGACGILAFSRVSTLSPDGKTLILDSGKALKWAKASISENTVDAAKVLGKRGSEYDKWVNKVTKLGTPVFIFSAHINPRVEIEKDKSGTITMIFKDADTGNPMTTLTLTPTENRDIVSPSDITFDELVAVDKAYWLDSSKVH